MTGFTKGPWALGGELISKAGTSIEIASVWSKHDARRSSPLGPEADTNRRLIVEAPALVEVLEEALEGIFGAFDSDGDDLEEWFPRWRERAKAVIARAKGEAS